VSQPDDANRPHAPTGGYAPTDDYDSTFDYVVVGGGTAGCVLAARLTEDPATRLCLIEGGPTDEGNDQVLLLKNWVSLLEGPLDYNYGTVEQPLGNSHIRHSRARVLGGCSSHKR